MDLKKLYDWQLHESHLCQVPGLLKLDDYIAGLLDPRCVAPGGYPWYPSQNHNGLKVYFAGIRDNDSNMKKLGRDLLEAGLARQQPDGAFNCNDAHHSSSFLLESIARFLILAPLNGEVGLEDMKAKFIQSIYWYQKRSNWNDDMWRDSLHHRFFLYPAPLMICWEHYSESDTLHQSILEQACTWMNEGMRRLEADGASTEFGGHDTGYHSLSLTYMCVILLGCELHERQRTKLIDCVSRATDWLMGRVNEHGMIDDSGNTRMQPNSKNPTRVPGSKLTIKPYESAYALYGAGLTLDSEECFDKVKKIKQYYPEDYN
jgi:hypothetical protein